LFIVLSDRYETDDGADINASYVVFIFVEYRSDYGKIREWWSLRGPSSSSSTHESVQYLATLNRPPSLPFKRFL